MKYLKNILVITAYCCVSSIFAQKINVKQAGNLVSSNKTDIPQARELIKAALENKETKDQAQTWYVAGLVEYRFFEEDRELISHGKKTDDNDMYFALLAAYNYWKKAYAIDSLPNKKGKSKPKFLKKIKEKLSPDYPYLANGGADAYNEKRYKDAYDFFDAYIDITQKGVFLEKKTPSDTNFQAIRFYRAVSATLMKDSELAVKCYEEIKNDTYNSKAVYSYLCLELERLGDTLRWESTLKEAIEKFPNEINFSKSLVNLYIYKDNPQVALDYLTKAIQKDSTSFQMWDVKGRIYEKIGQTKSALTCFEKALQLSPDNYDLLVNIGRIHYNTAVRKNDEVNKIKDANKYKSAMKGVNTLYQKALPYFEKAHKINPEGKDAIIALRGIYYKLMQFKKFDKMDRLFNQLNK